MRPDVGGLLPVFVLDRYEGYGVKRVQECTREELAAWVEANASAIGERGTADLLYVNHVLLGGAVGAASSAPYVVKAHGSELEYSMRGNAELSAWGGEVLASAAATVVGSEHIRTVVREVCGTVDRVHEIPPGVDVELWRPAPKAEALASLVAASRLDPPNAGNVNERLPDEGNALRLSGFLAGERPTVVYYGKLIENKGVQVLLEALHGLDARTVIVGFGDYRAELEARPPASTSSSPGRSSTGTSYISSRSRTSPSCRRSFPRRSGWSRPRRPRRAALRSSPTTRASPRSRAGWRRNTRRCDAGSRAFRTVTPSALRAAPRGGARAARRRARGASCRCAQGGGRALELGERRRTHPRDRRIGRLCSLP